MITLWQYSNSKPEDKLACVNLSSQVESLDELINHLPVGVYTTFRTFHKYSVLNFQAHIQRLERSASLISRSLVINQQLFRKNLRAALLAHPADENRVRVIITWEAPYSDETIFLAVEDLRVPSQELYHTGVRVKTIPLKRVVPEAKSTDFIRETSHLRTEITNGMNELLMVDNNGIILEGLSSNFFAIHQKTVHTVSSGILPGITRQLVLDIVRSISIPLDFTGIPLAEIGQLDEAFITSASRGVLPVVQINETVIGNGSPGLITQLLMKAYTEEIEKRIEPI